MTDAPAPFAAGKHLPWADVPAKVTAWAAGVGGGPPDRVTDLAGGFSPGATALLVYDDGPDVFVKAVGVGLNPDTPDLHRREAAIARSLPPSTLWPRLIDTYDDGDWVALALEAVDGRLPRHPWEPGELDRVVTALAGMHERLTPNPSDVAAPAAEGLRSVFGGWRILADGDTDGTGLNEWSRRHLGRLAALESAWPEACAGDTLLHVDLRSDNMLLTHDSVVFVDWPHAAVGPPVLDVLAWAPSVNLEGGPDPDELLARHPAARSADPEVVTVLVAALAGFLVQRSLLPPPPGLPTLRAFQGAQGEVALRWLRRRTGW